MVAYAQNFRPLSLDERRKHIAKTAEAEQGPRKRPMARERGDGLDVPIDLENLIPQTNSKNSAKSFSR